jgi:hypothetical protein
MKFTPVNLLVVATLLGAAAAKAQVSAGFKAGIPLDSADAPAGRATTEFGKPRWTVGPSVEVKAGGGFVVAADALYRRLNRSKTNHSGSADFFERSATSRWEVPLYLKFRFKYRKARPFVESGSAIAHDSVKGTLGCTGDPALCGAGAGTRELRSASWDGGILAGAGMEFQAGPWIFAPQFRYTRWTSNSPDGPGANQPAVYLGIRFRPRPDEID